MQFRGPVITVSRQLGRFQRPRSRKSDYSICGPVGHKGAKFPHRRLRSPLLVGFEPTCHRVIHGCLPIGYNSFLLQNYYRLDFNQPPPVTP